MKTTTSDVVVVGGGIMGAATAFFLSRRGRSVTLLEQGLVGQQASGVNFGNVRRQGRNLQELPLANRSRAIWGTLREILSQDVEFLPTGHLKVCYQREQLFNLEAYARDAITYDLELEIITGNALRARFPFLGPEVIAGSFSPNDGHANPRLVAPAFARAAARNRVSIIENAEAKFVEKVGEDFVINCGDQREFRAPTVLVATGAWGNRLSAQFCEPVPLVARGPQMAVTEPAPYSIRPVLGVSTATPEEVVYFRQVPRGNVIFGGGTRSDVFLDRRQACVKPHKTLAQLPQLYRIAPQLLQLHVIRVWSGVEGYLSDELPVIGPSGRVPGLYYAFGFCGHGFELGPGVGDVMAELIDTGVTSTPIKPFSITRFAQSTVRH